MGKECTEVENFFRREEISRAPGGAVESGRSDSPPVACFPRASPSCPRFPQAPRFAGGPDETGLRPSQLQRFPSDGRVGGEVVWRRRGVGGKDFDGVEPEAAKREPALGG